MPKDMVERVRAAIKDSEAAGPNHGVVLSKTDAKRVLYRLIKENEEWANRNLTPVSTR